MGTEPLDAQGQPKEPFPAEVNWPEVIRLSCKQKVSSLAVDGLKASGYDPYRGLTDQKAESLKQLMDAWQSDVATAEESYDYYLMVLNGFLASDMGLSASICKSIGLQASNDAKTNTHIATCIFESIPYGGSLLNRCLFYWRNRWRLNFVSGLQWTYFLRRALKSYFSRHKGGGR